MADNDVFIINGWRNFYVHDLFKCVSFTDSFVDSVVLNDTSFLILCVIHLFIQNEEIAIDKFHRITIYYWCIYVIVVGVFL